MPLRQPGILICDYFTVLDSVRREECIWFYNDNTHTMCVVFPSANNFSSRNIINHKMLFTTLKNHLNGLQKNWEILLNSKVHKYHEEKNICKKKLLIHATTYII